MVAFLGLKKCYFKKAIFWVLYMFDVKMKLRSKTFDFKNWFFFCLAEVELYGNRSGPSDISLILNVSRMFCRFCENGLIICQELYHGTCSSVAEFYAAGFMTD